MDDAEMTSQEKPETRAMEDPRATPVSSTSGKPVWVESDLVFIQDLSRQGGNYFLRCMQCGTCSATCTLSPDSEPFPRKEMAWATWGMKALLVNDLDAWLCHQCNDCSSRCPRGARPGGLLATIRQNSVINHALPRFFARWVNQPQCIPLLLGIPVALLTLALLFRDSIESALGKSDVIGEKIMFSYSGLFPHWLLNTFFGFFSLLALLVVITGVVRFWRGMKTAAPPKRVAAPTKKLGASIISTLKKIFAHSDFAQCTKARPRFVSHVCVFFGFLALTAVTLWVITSGVNPLIQNDFIYPFSFWNPWKMLANIGGLAVLAGCLLIIRDRLTNEENIGTGSYFDWALITVLLLVVVTGFITEVLHYLRLEPHRHVAYFVHLVFAFSVLIYLPYSKLAHMFYRGTAMVFAEHIGRNDDVISATVDDKQEAAIEEQRDMEKSTV